MYIFLAFTVCWQNVFCPYITEPVDWTQSIKLFTYLLKIVSMRLEKSTRLPSPIFFVLTPILFLKLCSITLFHIIVSLMTTSCTNLATLLNFLKLFSELSLVSLQLNNGKTEMILLATKTVLSSNCSTVHKSGGFWHQTCQHSSQPRCLSWSYSLFPAPNLLRLLYLLSWTLSD